MIYRFSTLPSPKMKEFRRISYWDFFISVGYLSGRTMADLSVLRLTFFIEDLCLDESSTSSWKARELSFIFHIYIMCPNVKNKIVFARSLNFTGVFWPPGKDKRLCFEAISCKKHVLSIVFRHLDSRAFQWYQMCRGLYCKELVKMIRHPGVCTPIFSITFLSTRK